MFSNLVRNTMRCHEQMRPIFFFFFNLALEWGWNHPKCNEIRREKKPCRMATNANESIEETLFIDIFPYVRVQVQKSEWARIKRVEQSKREIDRERASAMHTFRWFVWSRVFPLGMLYASHRERFVLQFLFFLVTFFLLASVNHSPFSLFIIAIYSTVHYQSIFLLHFSGLYSLSFIECVCVYVWERLCALTFESFRLQKWWISKMRCQMTSKICLYDNKHCGKMKSSSYFVELSPSNSRIIYQFIFLAFAWFILLWFVDAYYFYISPKLWRG